MQSANSNFSFSAAAEDKVKQINIKQQLKFKSLAELLKGIKEIYTNAFYNLKKWNYVSRILSI